MVPNLVVNDKTLKAACETDNHFSKKGSGKGLAKIILIVGILVALLMAMWGWFQSKLKKDEERERTNNNIREQKAKEEARRKREKQKQDHELTMAGKKQAHEKEMARMEYEYEKTIKGIQLQIEQEKSKRNSCRNGDNSAIEEGLHDEDNCEESTFDSVSLGDIVTQPQYKAPSPIMGRAITPRGIHVIYGETGSGKTILSMELGINLALGRYSKALNPEENCIVPLHKVLYYSYEMNEEQYNKRYLGIKNVDECAEESRIISDKECFEMFFPTDKSLWSMVKNVSQHIQDYRGTHMALFVDNLSYVKESMTDATHKKLLNKLKELITSAKERDITLSVVLLTHPSVENSTSDYKKLYHVLTKHGCKGSNTLCDGADVVIGVGPAVYNGKDVVRIKLPKVRMGENDKSKTAIAVLREEPYLHHEFIDYVIEKDVLPRSEKEGKINDKHNTSSCVSQVAIPCKRSGNLNLTEEQKRQILKMYTESNNYSETARRVQGDSIVFPNINKFDAKQVERIVKELQGYGKNEICSSVEPSQEAS